MPDIPTLFRFENSMEIRVTNMIIVNNKLSKYSLVLFQNISSVRMLNIILLNNTIE
jgi:hypothetical protein